MLEEKIRSIEQKTQVVLLPEMFSTGFSMKPELLAETMDGETVQWMARVAKQKRVILGGSLIVAESGGSGQAAPSGQTATHASGHTAAGTQYFNRFVWMQPNGQYGFYNKRHRFAFAGEDGHYTAGTERFLASVNGWKINLQVCYDLRFPVWARQSPLLRETDDVPHSFSGGEGGRQRRPDEAGPGDEAAPEYDALVYVANWPERRSLAWRTLLQARAIENQCYVIGVNRVGEDGNSIYHSGDSMVIDPLGEILYHKKDEEDVFTLTLDKTQLKTVREKFPFWKDGDAFQILV